MSGVLSILLAMVQVSNMAATPLPGSPLEAVSRLPTDIDGLYKEFRHPSNWYRMQYLIRTNDEVKPGEMEWQIKSIREQGGGGAFSYCEHLQGGSPEKFLTDWWWKVVGRTAAACAKEGIHYWSYDEEDWPSGTAGGKLLEQHPDLTWKYIRPKEHALKGPTSADLTIEDEPFVAAVAFQMDGKVIKPDSLTDLSDRVADRKLHWEVPAGEWTVAVYTAGTGKVWNAANYPDLMSQKAGAAFVDLVCRGHDERVKKIPGARVTGFFTDEPSMTIANYPAGKLFPWVPAMPYSFDLPEAFRREHGYEWRINLPLLYHDTPPQSLRFRCHHWESCNQLYVDNYFGQIYRFCDERGQISSGHLHIEESLMAHLTLQGGNMLKIFRNMHIPGIDWIHPFENALPANTPKFSTSVAHLQGKPRAWCESFAASGWGLTFQQMRRMLNWEHVNGINMVVPICYKYSVRGAQRAQFYVPGISYQQPYWDHFHGYADYDARLCALTAGGGHVAQIALAYPEADMWSHCWEHDLLSARSVVYFQTGDALRAAGYDYDVLDDLAIQKEAKIDGASLATKTEQFGILILPNVDTVSRPTLERALALADAGGTVLVQGGLPRHSIQSGSDDPEVARLMRDLLGAACYEQVRGGKGFWHPQRSGRVGFAPRVEELIQMLHEAVPPDLQMNPGSEGLCSYHRRLPGGELYLVLNRRDETRTVHFTLSSTGHPERWNPVTGAIEPLKPDQITASGVSLTLTLAPDELVPIVLRPKTSGSPAAEAKVVKEIAIPGPFKFHIQQTMSRPHVAWNFTQVQDGWKPVASPIITPTSPPPSVPQSVQAGDWCELGLSGFSGLGHYETDVDVPERPAGARTILDLGKVAVSAEIFVNGSSAGVVFIEPYRLDITPLVKTGRNQLRIVVANTLANYYGQFEEAVKAPLNAGGVKPEHKKSGLIGPVRMVIEK